ncbi:ARM repeat-containing protein [Didymella exigua CBS 183.55]|uniref:Nucleolar protein 9 n=1 Tax=Didymella exigua CBS 183.55 TaxID=1150837 RepID=A0A6A5R784_9PLEO|nr:ARM repeat-containing protein [Didymella exigua CBS 183.55]KAF1923602.1 ARM repeat-containing protein [Didymella exigua CBS 183.55]
MPTENRKRGRREEKKRKRDEKDADPLAKRSKREGLVEDILQQFDDAQQQQQQQRHHVDDQAPFQDEAIDGVTRPAAMPFYGMLDDDEQEYFKRADEMLELNHFDSADERSLFLASVWKEADGKELKIANSQSCSRLMERLILLSTPAQLKRLFQKFSSHFLHLVQHRFASHCCEALFIHAAPVVTQELASPDLVLAPSSDPDAVVVSMENLFLLTLAELDEHLGYLLTDRFASHVLRVLVVVLSGSPLEKQSKSAMQSKQKEKVAVAGADKAELALEHRPIPKSFEEALEKVVDRSVSGLDSNYLRTLSTHPLGNPTLQMLLKLELKHFGKSRAKDERSIIHKLLPDDPIAEGTESASFINGLVYDPIGSRLLETIIENAPGKLFKTMYAEFFQERIGSLSRNEIAGYVAGKILERLGKDDLADAMRQIVDQIPNLVERNRTAIIKTLIERCFVRDVDILPLTKQLELAYSGPNGFEISRILKLSDPQPDDAKASAKVHGKSDHSPEKVHGSLLAQAMMTVDGPLGNLIFDSLASLSTELALNLARDPTASRTLQAALNCRHASVIFRRKMIQQFYGHVGELALDPSASRVIDAIWEGTHGLAFIRERIAEELAENESALRESFVGRAVWRNWRMDLYKRKRADWVKQSRYTAGNDGFQSFPESNGATEHTQPGRHLSALERARQKHAAAKTAALKKSEPASKKPGRKEKSVATGSNKTEQAGKATVVAQ